VGFYITIIITRLKIILTPSFIITLLILPLSIVMLANMLSDNKDNKIKIGILYNEKAESKSVIDNFLKYIEDEAVIVFYETEKELIKDVMKNKIECGYIVQDIIQGNKSPITLFKSSLTTTSQIFDIMMAASVIQTKSGELGYNVLKKHFPNENMKDIKKEIQDNANLYLKDGLFMEINIIDVESIKDKPVDNNRYKKILHGLISIFSVLVTLIACATISDEIGDNMYNKLKSSGISLFTYFFGSGIAIFIINIFIFIISLSILSIIDTSILYKGIWETLYTVTYCFAISLFGILITLKFKINNYYTSIITFLFICTAIFGNTIINLEEILSIVAPIKYLFLSNYYSTGLSHNGFSMNIFALISISVLFSGLIYKQCNKL
jgi:hypothetical protein